MPDYPKIIKSVTSVLKGADELPAPKKLDLGNIKVRPPSDNVANVRDANFLYPKTIGNQTVDINQLAGGVRMNDPKEIQRVKALIDKISSPQGYISRIIVDHNNNVIEGQHRLEALRQLGVKKVPVFKIEDLSETMPVAKMEAAIKSAGGIHSDHVHQLTNHALNDISEHGIEGARNLDYGKFQKHYDAALDAARPDLTAAQREAGLAKFLEPSAEKRRMYHGSKNSDIKHFQTRKDMTDESNMTGHYADERDAVFLSPDPDFTKNFSIMGYTDEGMAPTTYPVHVQVQNPFDFDNPEHLKQVKETYKDIFHNPDSDFYNQYMLPSERSMAIHTFNKRVDSLPSDENNWGRIENQDFQDVLKDLGFDSFYTRERGTKNLGVYEPNRIKSAIGNRGTYDTTKPDINEAHGGAVHMQVGGLTKLAKMLSKKHIAPQEEALRLAQQRAALPINRGGLGLPANNTAEMRARAMFPEHGYSGKGDALGDDKLPMWLSENPALANTYTSGSSANVMPLRYNKGKQVIVDAKGQNWSALDENTPIRLPERMVEDEDAKLLAELLGEKYHPSLKHEPKSSKTFKDVFRQKLFNNELNTNDLADYSARKGYDSLRFQDIVDVGPSGRFMSKEAFVPSNNTVILNPDNVRSRFAAFDPWRKDTATAILMGVEAPDLLAKEPEMNKAQGGLAHFQVGGLTKAAKAAKEVIEEIVEGAPALAKASQRADAGRRAADVAKATAPMRLSEVLGNMNLEGKGTLRGTIADRTRVGGGNIGGPMFSGLQQVDPLYENAVWGVGKKGTASGMINKSDPNTLWSTILGNESQLKTNPLVFNKLRRGFTEAMKQGKLSDDLAKKINENLAFGFGEGADIRDPRIWQKADTFDKRAILADVMMGQNVKGGIPLGGEKSGKGVIFQPSEILKRETEPMLLHPEHGGDVPSYSVGPRLFNLSGEVEHRPDLHPGFPFILKGEDKGVVFKPPEGHIAMPDFTNEMKKKYGRTPGYFDWMMGKKDTSTGVTLTPMQEITDAYLTSLQKAGHKDGGSVDNQSFVQRLKDAIGKHMAEGGEASQDMDVAGLLQNSMDRGKDVPKFDEGGITKAEKTKGNPLTKYASAAKKIAVEEFLKEKEALSTPRGAKDIALKIGTSFTGQLPSLMNFAQRMIPALNEPTSVMNPSGETQLKYRIPYDTEEQNEVLKRIGVLGETEAPVVEFAGSLLGPAQLYKAIKGGLNAAKAR